MRWKQESWRVLIYGAAAIVLVLLLVRGLGYRLGFRSVQSERTAPAGDVDFGTDGVASRLVHDFPPQARPQNVVLMIGDGMGTSHLLAARAELVGLNRRLQLERMPITGWLTTHARTSLGTDSGAAATALATGQKVRPGRLALNKEGVALRTLVEEAVEQGMAVGLVTDSYLWDATLGAFASHVDSRRDYTAVAQQMAASGAELLVGTVRGNFSETDDEGRAKLEAFSNAGFAIARNWQSFETQHRKDLVSPGKLVGLFPVDQISDRQQAPTLSDLMEMAIERLSRHPEGFFLVVETEETDTASHKHDFQRMVRGIESFDEAAAHALDFASRYRQTLVMATGDHETGGLMLLNASPGGQLDVVWATDGHTATPVPLLAYGPGAELFSGAQDNTDFAKRLAVLLGFDLKVDESGG